MAKNTLQDLRLALDLVTAPPAAAAGGFGLAEGAPAAPARSWTTDPNIQGFGIAGRISKGKKLDEVALKVYVERKLPPDKVDSPIPPQIMLPGMKEPVPTDVHEIGKVQLEANTSRHRPAMPGCGLGHFDVTAGTFGCLVRKKGKPELYVLSNSHVLANSGTGKKGDVDLRTSLTYPTPDGGEGNVGLRDQVLCTRFTAGGDSGAAVFNSQNQIVGLHFAGTPSTSIFNRITNVLDALGLEIVTQAI